MSTTTSLVNTKKTVVSSSFINHIMTWNSSRTHIRDVFVFAAIMPPLVTAMVGIASGMHFVLGFIGAMVLTGSSVFFTHTIQAKKRAIAHVMSTPSKSTREKAELVATIKKFSLLPRDQYLALGTSTVKYDSAVGRYTSRSTSSATHNKEKGLRFTPKGVYVVETVSPMVTTVWDDALKAAEQVHFSRN